MCQKGYSRKLITRYCMCFLCKLPCSWNSRTENCLFMWENRPCFLLKLIAPNPTWVTNLFLFLFLFLLFFYLFCFILPCSFLLMFSDLSQISATYVNVTTMHLCFSYNHATFLFDSFGWRNKSVGYFVDATVRVPIPFHVTLHPIPTFITH